MDDEKEVLSQQSLRMLRQTIPNASRFSDEDLIATSIAIGSLFQLINDVPPFLPGREQASFFTNMVACFIIGPMTAAGLLNPGAAVAYINDSQDGKQATGINTEPFINNGQAHPEDGDDDIMVFNSKKGNVN